jgi:hypothetical protein
MRVTIKPFTSWADINGVGINIHNAEDNSYIGSRDLSLREARNLACELLVLCERFEYEEDLVQKMEDQTFKELGFDKDMLF